MRRRYCARRGASAASACWSGCEPELHPRRKPPRALRRSSTSPPCVASCAAMNDANTTTLLDPHVATHAGEYAQAFARQCPFRHVVIDNFLAADVAAKLLVDFPPFERGNARNEAGELGGKSTVERIRQLGTPYAALDDLLQSRPFLDLVSHITGIPDLLSD